MANSVLIIDDEGFDRVIIAALLRQAGWEVIGEAASGKEGISMAEELKPTLITLDKKMPDLDGFDVLKQLRAKGVDAQVILISGDDFSEQKEELKAMGFIDVFKKPVKREDLNACLASITP